MNRKVNKRRLFIFIAILIASVFIPYLIGASLNIFVIDNILVYWLSGVATIMVGIGIIVCLIGVFFHPIIRVFNWIFPKEEDEKEKNCSKQS